MTDTCPPIETLADIGEDALLARIFPELPPGRLTILGPGDDAAIVAVPDGRMVVSTDVLVEGRHFRQDFSGGADVGWRSAMQNLADIAAMGATPSSLVVALVLPPELAVEWVVEFARGLREACEPYGVGVVGGDLSSGDAIVVAVTVHGDLDGRAPTLRSGARAGDVVAHAGVAGRSAAGHAVLDSGRLDLLGEEPGGALAVADAVRAYRRPAPPLDAGPVAATAGATAMMDLSDGLLRDAGRMARASGVVIDLDRLETAFPADLAAVTPLAQALGADPRDWVVAGGEDHGLLATFPAGATLPMPFRAIGVVRALTDAPSARGRPAVLVAGSVPTVSSPGWDHFRARAPE